VPLKRSPDYGSIRRRVADLRPIDAWEEEGLHFFVFQLRPADGPGIDHTKAPVAVFTMHPEATTPLAAVVVSPNGEHAEVMDLRQPESVYTVPLAP
jgi:hypothetical protein